MLPSLGQGLFRLGRLFRSGALFTLGFFRRFGERSYLCLEGFVDASCLSADMLDGLFLEQGVEFGDQFVGRKLAVILGRMLFLGRLFFGSGGVGSCCTLLGGDGRCGLGGLFGRGSIGKFFVLSGLLCRRLIVYGRG